MAGDNLVQKEGNDNNDKRQDNAMQYNFAGRPIRRGSNHMLLTEPIDKQYKDAATLDTGSTLHLFCNEKLVSLI